MGQDRGDLREKVTGKAGGLAKKAEAKAAEKGLSRKQVAEQVAGVKDEVRAKGEKAVGTSLKGARLVVAGVLRNKVRVAVAAAATAVMAAVIAGRRVVGRRKS